MTPKQTLRALTFSSLFAVLATAAPAQNLFVNSLSGGVALSASAADGEAAAAVGQCFAVSNGTS